MHSKNQQNNGDCTQRVTRQVCVPIPNEYTEQCDIVGYTDASNEEHVALIIGGLDNLHTTDEPVLVRIHSSCKTGDIFHSARCDCQYQLHTALEMMAKEGKGVLVYLDQEGRGIGLINKLKAYELQDKGMDTVEANIALGFEADQRDLQLGPAILKDLDIKKIRLLTNNPKKIQELQDCGFAQIERISIIMPNQNKQISKYLQTKQEKMGHMTNE